MIRAAAWASLLRDRHYDVVAGVPCSSLHPLYSALQTSDAVTYLAAPNEGQAVAVASGAVMGGRRAIALMQNSGLGNAVNPLTSLVETFRLPLLLIISWRGQPGRPDEPQHVRMGLSTHAILDAIDVPHITVEDDEERSMRPLCRAIDIADGQRRCVSLIVPDGVFSPVATAAAADGLCYGRDRGRYEDLVRHGPAMSRTEALGLLCALTRDDTIRLATTGKTGRELFALGDDPLNLYVVGSMGLASSLGLGLSLGVSHRILVIDGDGAALMHLGALPMIARYGGRTFLHVVIDNGCYDSTGGQVSLADQAPFAGIAACCGYAYAARVDDEAGLVLAMRAAGSVDGPSLLHVLVHPGSPGQLPRPTLAPPEILARLQQSLSIVG